jgi:hypothetical protein
MGQTLTNYGAQLLNLQFGRRMNQKPTWWAWNWVPAPVMTHAGAVAKWPLPAKGAPPQWLSTHHLAQPALQKLNFAG